MSEFSDAFLVCNLNVTGDVMRGFRFGLHKVTLMLVAINLSDPVRPQVYSERGSAGIGWFGLNVVR